jgi:hypothetical protein
MQFEHVLTRLRALEAEREQEFKNRRVRRRFHVAAWTAAVAVGLLGAMRAPEVPKVVEAESFVLRDSAGKARMEISVFESEIGLAFTDAEGKDRLVLGIQKNDGSPYLCMMNDVGEPGGTLRLSKENGATLSLRDSKESDGIVIQTRNGEGGGFSIFGPDEERRVVLRTFKSGDAWLSLQNREKSGTATFSVGAEGKQ